MRRQMISLLILLSTKSSYANNLLDLKKTACKIQYQLLYQEISKHAPGSLSKGHIVRLQAQISDFKSSCENFVVLFSKPTEEVLINLN